MFGILEGEDLFAKNTIYHRSCMASYISEHNVALGQQQEESPITDNLKLAFETLISENDTDLTNGKAF